MKRIYFILLSLMLVLCACGGNGNNTTTNPESKISDSPIGKELQTLTGLNSKTEKIHGLIFVDYMHHVTHYTDGNKRTVYSEDGSVVRVVDPGDEVVDYLDGDIGFKGIGYAVYCLDPDTGKETKISSFYFPDLHINESGKQHLIRDPYPEGHPGWVFYSSFDGHEYYPERRYFSDDYSKMACEIRGYVDGTQQSHVGWVDTDGSFFDVTEALGLGDSELYGQADGFSGDFFGYSIGHHVLNGTYYVPVNDISSENINEGDIRTVGHPCGEDGYLHVDNHKFHPRNVTSWLDDTHAIINGSNYLVINNISYDIACSKIIDTDKETITEYIPENLGETWNGVASPDGSKIAFVSTSGVYIIPTNGGDPIQVEIPHALAKNQPTKLSLSEYEGWNLIDWW